MHFPSVYIMLFHTTYCLINFGSGKTFSSVTTNNGGNMWQKSSVQPREYVSNAIFETLQ